MRELMQEIDKCVISFNAQGDHVHTFMYKEGQDITFELPIDLIDECRELLDGNEHDISSIYIERIGDVIYVSQVSTTITSKNLKVINQTRKGFFDGTYLVHENKKYVVKDPLEIGKFYDFDIVNDEVQIYGL